MHAAAGILTARGGMTSHAAVVARGWGKCCVSGCSDIRVNDAEKVVDYLLASSPHTHTYIVVKSLLFLIGDAGCVGGKHSDSRRRMAVA